MGLVKEISRVIQYTFTVNSLIFGQGIYRSLASLKVAKAVGPDNIPNKLSKDFAPELAPLIREIYNWRKGTFRLL